MIVRAEGINALYKRTIMNLLDDPTYIVKPRGMKINEDLNSQLILANPRKRFITIPERKISNRYLAGEFCFYMAGSDSLSFIEYYSKFWQKVSDDGKTVNSCYGKKLFYDINRHDISQFNYAKEQLLKDEDSRKAIAIIYTRNNADLNTKDNPCTMNLQFFIRINHLMLTVYMRSNDIWLGTPYDIGFFTMVQELMLIRLQRTGTKYKDLILGSYTHLVGSLHLYERHFEKAETIASSKPLKTLNTEMPSMTNNTWEELDCFLEIEKAFRTNQDIDGYNTIITDPFLKLMMTWLLEEE